MATKKPSKPKTKAKDKTLPPRGVPTDVEISDVLDICTQAIDEGITRHSGMTYESGVKAAIDWLRGDVDTSPFED